MSYDAIINALIEAGKATGEGLLTAGKFAGGALEKVGEGAATTLLGSVPKTGSLPAFTGSVLTGLTDPHGLLGQTTRLAGVVAAFGHSPQSGLAVLDAIQKGDAARAAELGSLAAQGLTIAEGEQQVGHGLGGGIETAPQAVDLAPGGPSAPEARQVIQFPTDPEQLAKIRHQQIAAERLAPGFEANASPEAIANYFARAQIAGLPTSTREKNVGYDERLAQIGGFNPGVYRTSTSIGQGGETQSTFLELPPEDKSMTQEIIDRIVVPENFAKVITPDPANEGMAFVKIVNNRTGMSINDIVERSVRGDPVAKAMIPVIEEVYGTMHPETKPQPGSLGDFIGKAVSEFGDLSPEELQAGVQAYHTKSNPLGQIMGKQIEGPSPTQIWYEKLRQTRGISLSAADEKANIEAQKILEGPLAKPTLGGKLLGAGESLLKTLSKANEAVMSHVPPTPEPKLPMATLQQHLPQTIAHLSSIQKLQGIKEAGIAAADTINKTDIGQGAIGHAGKVTLLTIFADAMGLKGQEARDFLQAASDALEP